MVLRVLEGIGHSVVMRAVDGSSVSPCFCVSRVRLAEYGTASSALHPPTKARPLGRNIARMDDKCPMSTELIVS